jgi:biopolymer transport protein ExbD
MAELNTGDGGGKKSGKVRSKKANSKVDLTAMVDLAFLLITFFMLTTSLNKPQSMDLGMPDKPKKDEIKEDILVDERRTMTIILGENNKVMNYMGLIESPIEAPKVVAYGREGIRKDLLKRVVSVPAVVGPDSAGKPRGLIVIIKPGKKSTYKNLVDILDEMAICKIQTYAIVGITPAEVALLEKK